MSENNNRTSIRTPDMEQDISDAAMDEEEAKGFNSLVNIRVTSYRKRRHDPDGISVKAVLDGIVRRGILKDDSTDQINEVTFKSIICKKGEPEKTVIEIEDI